MVGRVTRDISVSLGDVFLDGSEFASQMPAPRGPLCPGQSGLFGRSGPMTFPCISGDPDGAWASPSFT